MLRFEEYIEKTNGVCTPAELFDLFVDTVKAFGFDKILFGLATDHNDIDVKAGIGIIQNYPSDWMKYYHENSFQKIDPIVTYGVHQPAAFAWDDISKHVELKRIQHKCLNLSAEAGLHNGLTVPLRGPQNQIAGLSLATSSKKDACYFAGDLLTAYCNQFYLVYKRLHSKKTVNPKNIVLTASEAEILKWAALGKTDDEISEILMISKHTVNMHFRNIYTKLEATNRVVAVVKALSTGLIAI